MDANWCCIDCIFLSKMTTFDLHDVTWFIPIFQAVASLPFLLCGKCSFYILRSCMCGFHPTPRSISQKKGTCLLTSPELYYIIYSIMQIFYMPLRYSASAILLWSIRSYLGSSSLCCYRFYGSTRYSALYSTIVSLPLKSNDYNLMCLLKIH